MFKFAFTNWMLDQIQVSWPPPVCPTNTRYKKVKLSHCIPKTFLLKRQTVERLKKLIPNKLLRWGLSLLATICLSDATKLSKICLAMTTTQWSSLIQISYGEELLTSHPPYYSKNPTQLPPSDYTIKPGYPPHGLDQDLEKAQLFFLIWLWKIYKCQST